MWRLHRYYLREVAIDAAIAFAVLFAVVLVSLVAKGINKTQGDLGAAALTTLFFALDTLPHLVMIAFLIATVMAYTRAAQDRELIAIRAAGVPPTAAMAPALLLGLVLAAVSSTAIHWVIPDLHYRKYRVLAEAFSTVVRNLKLDSDRLQVPGADFVVTYRARGADGDMRDCAIYCPPGKELVPGSPILLVDRLVFAADEEIFRARFLGVSGPFGHLSGEIAVELSTRDIANQDRRDERDDDIRTPQLLSELLQGVHPEPHKAGYVLLRRCCFGLTPALFAPIGYCIAELARMRGRVVALLCALLPLAAYYVGEIAGARVMQATKTPWGAALPLVLLVAGALPLCWRQLRR